jgi:hypothetical protein
MTTYDLVQAFLLLIFRPARCYRLGPHDKTDDGDGSRSPGE